MLVSPATPTLDELSEMGIERVSTGSAPFRATITLLRKMSEDVIFHGNFQRMNDDVISYAEINEMLKSTNMGTRFMEINKGGGIRTGMLLNNTFTAFNFWNGIYDPIIPSSIFPSELMADPH